MVAEVLIEQNVHVLNSGVATRDHPIPGENSVPDISVATDDIVNNINWERIDDLMGSDHYPLRISINSGKLVRESVQQRIGINKVEWPVFDKFITEYISSLPDLSPQNIQSQYTETISNIVKGLGSAGARLKPRERRHAEVKIPTPAIWWDEECSQAIRNRRRTALNQSTKH